MKKAGQSRQNRAETTLRIVLALGMLVPLGWSQTTESSSKPKQQPQAEQKPPAPAGEAGGPQGDVGSIAVPKKKPEEKPPEKPARIKNPEGMPDYSLRVNVPLVNVDVGVLTKDGQFIPGLKKENFRILEDGVPQPIVGMNQTEAPITAVLLVEFANSNYQFIEDMLNGAYTFTSSLKKEDWVAVMTYDMQTRIIQDFTQDKRAIFGALNTLRIPGFSETNMFDAMYEAIDRTESIDGRKYIVLISSGRDTFSKITYDKILNKIKATQNVTIYTVGTGQAVREYYDSRGAMGATTRLDYLQADNQMGVFARMTGGRSYFPHFQGELPDIFREIAQTIRNQYMISYHPSNGKQDGTFRKLKVELVDGNGNPLTVVDEKGKKMKYQVIAKDGYRAKQVVE